MMNKIFSSDLRVRIILFFAISIVCISCSDPGDCLKSTGTITKQERTLPLFTKIHVTDNVNIIFTNDSGSTITVEAGKHLLSNIKTEVEDGMLNISNDNTCNWVRSYKKDLNVYIGIKNVKDVFNYGYGNMSSDELYRDTLFIHHYGNGDIHINIHAKRIWMDMDHLGDLILDGTVNTLNAFSYNLGELKAQGLQADTIYLKNTGQGNSYVNAQNVLGVTIKNEGNVYYYGNPANIGVTKDGKGDLIKGN